MDSLLAERESGPVGAYLTVVCRKTKQSSGGNKPTLGTGVEQFLKEHEIEHEVIIHKRVRNAAELQRTLQVGPGELVKSIILVTKSGDVEADRLGGQIWVMIIQGDRRLSFSKVDEALQRKRREWRFATQIEVSNMFGLEIGGVPAFGYRDSVSVLADSHLLLEEWVYCGSGEPDRSVRIRSRDLIRSAKARVCDLV
jgi:prolyl-tRNA editing enzyme YbaK/EbsC (Cys-tRNA(Pro) deacylase)